MPDLVFHKTFEFFRHTHFNGPILRRRWCATLVEVTPPPPRLLLFTLDPSTLHLFWRDGGVLFIFAWRWGEFHLASANHPSPHPIGSQRIIWSLSPLPPCAFCFWPIHPLNHPSSASSTHLHIFPSLLFRPSPSLTSWIQRQHLIPNNNIFKWQHFRTTARIIGKDFH